MYGFMKGNYMTRLTFKTNLNTYHVLEEKPDDEDEGIDFVLEEKDHKIVGFHGMSSKSSLKQIGVYVKPIE